MAFFENYHSWLKVADTALPRNMIGYLTQLCLGPLRADPFTLLPYDNPDEIAKCGHEVGTSFLHEELPEREGPRPEVSAWIAPHRQITQLTGDDMHKVCGLDSSRPFADRIATCSIYGRASHEVRFSYRCQDFRLGEIGRCFPGCRQRCYSSQHR